MSLNQSQFANFLGISGNFVSNLELGKAPPTKPILLLIEIRWSISTDWILTGEGERYIKEEPDTKEAAPTKMVEGEPAFTQQEFIQNFFNSFGYMLNHLDNRLKSIENRITSIEGELREEKPETEEPDQTIQKKAT